MMKKKLFLMLFSFVSVICGKAVADEALLKPREVPARTIPVPTDVSPELQQNISLPLNPLSLAIPKTPEEWKDLIDKSKKSHAPLLQTAVKLFPVDIKNAKIAGVNTYTVTPKVIPKEKLNKVILFLHGGAFVFNGGEGCLPEAMAMAHYGQITVIAVDYRLLPQYPFPAALEDALGVYKEVTKVYKPGNIALAGTSAAGGLAAATILALADLKLPLPSSVSLGTPLVDLTKTGDTLYTNEDIDNVFVTYDGLTSEIVKLYAGKYDMKNPLLSPIYGDLKGFPPTILTSGTRDLLLSCTVRMHQKLKETGIEAYLQVFEGCSHAFYVQILDSPESKQAYLEIIGFFEKHFEKSSSENDTDKRRE